MALYVGFDSSTQGLSALVIDVERDRRAIAWSGTINFDRDLPAYGTHHGILDSDDPLIAVAPPALWAEALDLVMARLSREVDVSRVSAIAGSAQQHGSVYLRQGADARLRALDPATPLVDQLVPAFARTVSPIWRDASTSRECRAITDALGGPQAVAALTGSRAFERFTGPQIRRFASNAPEAYAETERVHLVSSFLCSLLIGAHAPLDPGDASGMNLMDIARNDWAQAALDATASDLRRRLPSIVPASTIVGRLSPYWRARHGWPAVPVAVWSGDNPCSLVGTGLTSPGQVAISLGTSDTVFGPMAMPSVDLSGTGHVFGAPTGAYMGLTCFQNGSLARERVREAAGLDWDGVSAALAATPPGNHGRLVLPWFEPEITPLVLDPGVRRQGLDAHDVAGNVRGVFEGQMLAMARHSAWMGVTIDSIRATGGAAVNRDLLRIMADVFNATVVRADVSNSAALGAALRAWHAEAAAQGTPRSWADIVSGFTAPADGPAVTPEASAVAVYRDLAVRHGAFERQVLGA